MKNFPHQINQIPRLIDALHVIQSLSENGEDILDDGVLGDALVRASVHRLRRNGRPLEELLNEEHEKLPGDQGARTCARDFKVSL